MKQHTNQPQHRQRAIASITTMLLASAVFITMIFMGLALIFEHSSIAQNPPTRTPTADNNTAGPAPAHRINSEGIPAGTPIAIVSSTNPTGQYSLCTTGFTITDKKGGKWAITAGHCGKLGDHVYIFNGADNPLPPTPIGQITVTGVGDTSTEHNPSSDWSAIKLNDTTQPEGIMGLSSDIPTMISYTSHSQPGTQVCKWGITTGKTCGNIEQSNVLVRAEGDNGMAFYTRTTEAAMCSEKGDSGAPVYTSSLIIGILSSTTTPQGQRCGPNSKTEYTPTSTIIRSLNNATGLFTTEQTQAS